MLQCRHIPFRDVPALPYIDMQHLVSIFKALGEERRLRIMHLFVRSHQALCICEMVDALDIPQYQVSRHVRFLYHSGMLKLKKKGTWSYYYLNEENGFYKYLIAFLEKVLVSDLPERDWKAMQVRLSYREKGRCVRGCVPYSEILRQMQQNPDYI